MRGLAWNGLALVVGVALLRAVTACCTPPAFRVPDGEYRSYAGWFDGGTSPYIDVVEPGPDYRLRVDSSTASVTEDYTRAGKRYHVTYRFTAR